MSHSIQNHPLPQKQGIQSQQEEQQAVNMYRHHEHNMDKRNPNEVITKPHFKIRLYLIRHGETEANRRNIVLGQSDSPLTENGIQDAIQTGIYIQQNHSFFVEESLSFSPSSSSSSSDSSSSTTADMAEIVIPNSFWRCYTSDLFRAYHTACLIFNNPHKYTIQEKHDFLQEQSLVLNKEISSVISLWNRQNPKKIRRKMSHGNSQKIHRTSLLRVDARLRERAKGLREGKPKDDTWDPQEEEKGGEKREQGDKKIILNTPKSETEEQVWERFQDWISSLVEDAYSEYQHQDKGSHISNDNSKFLHTKNEHEQQERKDDDESKDKYIKSFSFIIQKDPSMNHVHENTNMKKHDMDTRCFHVFAVSHSGTLRIAIENILQSQQKHSNMNGHHPVPLRDTRGRLIVPNTSMTVIDIIPDFEPVPCSPSTTTTSTIFDEDNDHGTVTFRNPEDIPTKSTKRMVKWKATVVRIASVDHLRKDS